MGWMLIEVVFNDVDVQFVGVFDCVGLLFFGQDVGVFFGKDIGIKLIDDFDVVFVQVEYLIDFMCLEGMMVYIVVVLCYDVKFVIGMIGFIVEQKVEL